MKKTLTLISITFLLCLLVAPALGATYTVTADYDFAQGAAVGVIAALHPSETGSSGAKAQTFNASTSGYLTSITIAMNKTGSPTGTLAIRLEGCGNNLNASPNGTVFITSYDTVSIATLATGVPTNYTFNFGSTYYLTANTKYAWVIYTTEFSGDGSNYIGVLYDITAPDDEGYGNAYASSNWVGPSSGHDYVYEVLVVDTFGGGSSGGLPTYEAGDYDSLIASLVQFVVPIFILMLPVILLIMITRSTDKWIILIGLTIGVGLGYFFGIVPLWLVFLVTIGLIGMAYQSVRGGNS